MAEFNKKDAFYFPHFCNARHDRKIRRVRKELGAEGYGIFFMLLEVLREQADYCYPMEDLDLLSEELGTSEQKVRTIICNYDLFQVNIKEEFFSSNLIMYLQPYLKNKESRRIGGIKGNLIRYEYCTKEELKGKNPLEIMEIASNIEGFSHTESVSDQLISQIKGDKVKEIKESKGNEKHRDSLSTIIQSSIDHWNTKEDLPICKYSVLNLPDIGNVKTKFDVFSSIEINEAIDNLSEFWNEEEMKVSSFHRFVTVSLDRWLESADPRSRYENTNDNQNQLTEEDIKTIEEIQF